MGWMAQVQLGDQLGYPFACSLTARTDRLAIAEHMQLDAIERALCGDDPQLAAAFRTGSAPRTAVRRIPVIAGAVLLVVLAVLLGGVAGG